MSEDRVLTILRDSDFLHESHSPHEVDPGKNAARARRSKDVAAADGAKGAPEVERPPRSADRAVLPKYNIESVVVTEYGGVFVVGWIDDSVEALDKLCITGSSWQLVFTGGALARTRRDDVQAALGTAR